MANRSILRGFLFAVTFTAAACGGGSKKDTTPKDSGSTIGSSQVDPTLCDTSGKNVVTYDLNKDNHPDVWRLFKTEDEGGAKVEWMTCKQVDFDHDGRKDWVVGFNRKGSRLVEKVDMDYDGQLVAILYDDNYDGQVDRRDEVPGSRPKIEMPTPEPGPAESSVPPD